MIQVAIRSPARTAATLSISLAVYVRVVDGQLRSSWGPRTSWRAH